jgi:molybdopterin synthase sulfur carrier subunit
MEIQIFGRLTEIIGNSGFNPERVENTDQLRKKLIFLYPALSDIDYAIAVNNQLVRGNYPLQKEDVVALLPPFSGG